MSSQLDDVGRLTVGHGVVHGQGVVGAHTDAAIGDRRRGGTHTAEVGEVEQAKREGGE